LSVKLVAAIAALLLTATAALAQTPHFDERLRLHRQLQALNAELLSHDSATAVLQAICDRRAPGVKITAALAADPPDESDTAAARADLGVGPGEPIRYRRVDLACGDQVLSNAENWYLPSRLTPAMNRALDETRTPFGVVVGPLQFHRRTLAEAEFLFEPLPAGWEREPPATYDSMASPPPHVLRHRAVLATPDGRPFSLVVESYTELTLTP
jgi:hypothetical protein